MYNSILCVPFISCFCAWAMLHRNNCLDLGKKILNLTFEFFCFCFFEFWILCLACLLWILSHCWRREKKKMFFPPFQRSKEIVYTHASIKSVWKHVNPWLFSRFYDFPISTSLTNSRRITLWRRETRRGKTWLDVFWSRDWNTEGTARVFKLVVQFMKTWMARIFTWKKKKKTFSCACALFLCTHSNLWTFQET